MRATTTVLQAELCIKPSGILNDYAEGNNEEDTLNYEPSYGKGEIASEIMWKYIIKIIKQAETEDSTRPSKFNTHNINPPDMARSRREEGKSWTGLEPFQVDGVWQTRAGELGMRGLSNGSIMADSMGLGKTVQMLALMLEWPIVGTALIVLPANLISNWLDHIQEFANNFTVLVYDKSCAFEDLKNYDIVICTYDKLRIEYSAIRKFREDMELRHRKPYPYGAWRVVKKKGVRVKRPLHLKKPGCTLLRMNWTRIVFDEGQNFKSFKKDTFKACRALKGQHRHILTGTIFSNEYGDVHSVFSVLKLAPLNDSKFFREHFVLRAPKKKNGTARVAVGLGGIKLREHEIQVLNSTRTAFLWLILDGESVRRTRDSIYNGESLSKGFPEKDVRTEYVDLNNELTVDRSGKYEEFFQYEGREVPAGFNSDEVVLETIKGFFSWLTSGEEACWGDGLQFKEHIINFHPRTEQETQHKTRIQWSNKLRDIIELEMGGDEKDKSLGFPVYPKGYRDLLGDMTKARLAACHWALPGAKYDDPADAIDEDNPGLAKTAKQSRTKFQKYIKQGENWRSTKMEWAVAYVKGELADGHEIVVTSFSLGALDILAIALEKNGVKVLRYDGHVSLRDRKKIRLQFQEQALGTPRVMLLTTGAGGTGIDLTRADRMLFLTPEWSEATEVQVADRIWRRGQTRHCEIVHLRANNSMDVRIEEKQDTKHVKAFNLMDLYIHDLDRLDDDTREFVEQARSKVEEMKRWAQLPEQEGKKRCAHEVSP